MDTALADILFHLDSQRGGLFTSSYEVVDYYLQWAFRLQYEFATTHGSTLHLPRIGQSIDYRGQRLLPTQSADHETGEIAAVQFHPKSIMTLTLAGEIGLEIIKNVVRHYTQKLQPIV